MMKACVVTIFSLSMAGSPAFAAPAVSAAGQLEAVDSAPGSAGEVYDNQAAGRPGPVVSGTAHAGSVSMLKRRPAKEKITSSASRPTVHTPLGSYYLNSDGNWVNDNFARAFNWVMRPASVACASKNVLGRLAGVLYGIVMVVPAAVVGFCAVIVG